MNAIAHVLIFLLGLTNYAGGKPVLSNCISSSDDGELKIASGNQGGCCVYEQFYPTLLGCCNGMLYHPGEQTCCYDVIINKPEQQCGNTARGIDYDVIDELRLLNIDQHIFRSRVHSTSCDFEQSNCGWAVSSTNNQFAWNRKKTERDVHHTSDGGGGFYLYADTSNSGKPDRTFFISPKLRFVTPQCIVFWYRVDDVTITSSSELVVHPLSTGLSQTREKLSNHGNEWSRVQIDVGAGEYRIAFIARTGNATNSNVAIDDVEISEGKCRAQIRNFSCDFDHDFCGWKPISVNRVMWQRHRGFTPSQGTGPSSSHTEYGPVYAYVEASGRRKSNASALLSSPSVDVTSPKCVKFWYHMHGRDVGSLSLLMTDHHEHDLYNENRRNAATLWSMASEQGDRWMEANVNVTGNRTARFLFQVILRQGHRGDVAIDDVTITDGLCEEELKTSLSDIDCDFDSLNFCGWRQENSTDEFDWLITSGESRVSNAFLLTGPTHDHTTNATSYAYIASNGQADGDVARLMSPSLTLRRPPYCFTFWCHVRGYDTGNLTVHVKEQSKNDETIVWQRRMLEYDGEADWLFTSIDVTNPLSYIIIEGGVRSYFGDLAVDDVRMFDGDCKAALADGAKIINAQDDVIMTSYEQIAASATKEKPSLVHPPSADTTWSRRIPEITLTKGPTVGPARPSADVIFMLDAAHECGFNDDYVTVPSATLDKSKSFVMSFLRQWHPVSTKRTRVAMISYAGWTRVEFDLNEHNDRDRITRFVENTSPMCADGLATSHIPQAMRFVHRFVTSQFKGDRHDVTNIIVVLMRWSGISSTGWDKLGKSYGDVYKENRGKMNIVVAVGMRSQGDEWFKSELSLVACGHVIFQLCDGAFIVDDVKSVDDVIAYITNFIPDDVTVALEQTKPNLSLVGKVKNVSNYEGSGLL